MIVSAPFDWSAYLTLAEELAIRADEASLRSALSRAYYYVYHLALKRAQTNGFKAVPGEGTHIQLWRLFSQSPESACKHLAQIAGRLKEKRERADYELVFVRLREEVPQLLADARDFAKRLANLQDRHPSPSSVRQ